MPRRHDQHVHVCGLFRCYFDNSLPQCLRNTLNRDIQHLSIPKCPRQMMRVRSQPSSLRYHERARVSSSSRIRINIHLASPGATKQQRRKKHDVPDVRQRRILKRKRGCFGDCSTGLSLMTIAKAPANPVCHPASTVDWLLLITSNPSVSATRGNGCQN